MTISTRHEPGVGSVGQYQMSGQPFATGGFEVPAAGSAPLKISFPKVTQWIWIKNNDANNYIKLGFSLLGTTGSGGRSGFNYVVIGPDTAAQTFRVRCNSIFLVAAGRATSEDISIMAGLTGINSQLSGVVGENYSGSLGVG